MSSIQAKNFNHPGYSENLKEEKYSLVREAILATLPDEPGESMPFSELEAAVQGYLQQAQVPEELFPKPGSVRCPPVRVVNVAWHWTSPSCVHQG